MIPKLSYFTGRTGRASGTAGAATADAQLAEQMAFAMTYLLDLGDEQGQAMAHTALLQRQRLRSNWTAPTALPAAYKGAAQAVHAALEHSPCLLALPFSAPGIELLRALSADAGLRLVLIESPTLRAVRDEIPLASRALPVCATRDAIKQVKAESNRGTRTVYVSFPELHSLSHGTTAPVSFLNKPCRFSVFDPLLCLYGLDTLLTPAGDGVTLLSWDASTSRHAGQGAAIRACLHWLIGNLQASAAAAPTATLSWHQLYRTSFHCYEIERENQLKQLDAYVAAWKRSPAGQANPTLRLASTRIAALRGARSS